MGLSVQFQPARDVPGVLAQQGADQVFLLLDLLFDGGNGPRGAVNQLFRLAHIEH